MKRAFTTQRSRRDLCRVFCKQTPRWAGRCLGYQLPLSNSKWTTILQPTRRGGTWGGCKAWPQPGIGTSAVPEVWVTQDVDDNGRFGALVAGDRHKQVYCEDFWRILQQSLDFFRNSWKKSSWWGRESDKKIIKFTITHLMKIYWTIWMRRVTYIQTFVLL